MVSFPDGMGVGLMTPGVGARVLFVPDTDGWLETDGFVNAHARRGVRFGCIVRMIVKWKRLTDADTEGLLDADG